jgi:hypothetical protein
MSVNTIAVIVAVGLLLLSAILVCLALRMRESQRLRIAQNGSVEGAEETPKITHYEAYSDEAAADGCTARNEADVKGAQPVGSRQEATAAPISKSPM